MLVDAGCHACRHPDVKLLFDREAGNAIAQEGMVKEKNKHDLGNQGVMFYLY